MKKSENTNRKKEFLLKITITVAVLMTFALSAQTAQKNFEDGNAQYAKANYQEAVAAYEKALSQGQESPALFYNLGNANYKLNRIAPAIYNYERALKLSPSDSDIKNNLAYAQRMTIDAITPLPENTFKKWYNAVLNIFTLDGWAVMSVVLILLFMVSFITYCLVYGTRKKRIFFTSAFTVLTLGLLALFFAFRSEQRMHKDRPAIVFAPMTEVKAEPNPSSDDAFTLHEGTKVMVLSEDDKFKEIRLADGKEGWISKTDIKEF